MLILIFDFVLALLFLLRPRSGPVVPIGVRRPEFREVSIIFSGPLLTRHVHILINYNA
jgi:hypothetical protein